MYRVLVTTITLFENSNSMSTLIIEFKSRLDQEQFVRNINAKPYIHTKVIREAIAID